MKFEWRVVVSFRYEEDLGHTIHWTVKAYGPIEAETIALRQVAHHLPGARNLMVVHVGCTEQEKMTLWTACQLLELMAR